ncbi:DUF1090 domain-containing protein [Enterobacter pseudoroggenkampii]|uniref:DUF1090 domain-containing protein n=1 Tax=Enterobacter pseudoroggenkampii TaxID=2996112 RepID=UPI0025AFF43F|nr:DUF1090 domain-containing protein [Enterobacter pseudoroggenkampii]WJW96582.1 DUF1090 domain-containing protein [Enterobacter pseudoroggenkampii]
MKPIIISVLTLTSFGAIAQLSETCAIKESEIESQIKYAQLYQNTERLAGLEVARDKLRLNCSEGALEKERNARIADKEKKVAERKEKLAEAKHDGRNYKIEQAERKLSHAQDELNALKHRPYRATE